MIPILLVCFTAATGAIIVGFLLIGPKLLGAFFTTLGDSGIGGTTANSAINIEGGFLLLAAALVAMLVAVALALFYGGRRRRRSPRGRV